MFLRPFIMRSLSSFKVMRYICSRFLSFICFSIVASSCVSVGRITTLGEQPCAEGFQEQLAAIMTEEGENPTAAQKIAAAATLGLQAYPIGKRTFLVQGADTDYFFFLQNDDGICLLRLFSKQSGFIVYTNNLTYIATKKIQRCRCED